jgi:hypothetical protein
MDKRPEGLDEQSGNKLADGLLLPIFAVAAVFLFIILCFYAYNNVMKNKDNKEVVELQGDSSDFKVAPQDPGGMEVEHTDKAVFNTVTGQQENTDGKVNVEQQEQAISAEQLAASSEGVSSGVPTQGDETTHSTISISGDPEPTEAGMEADEATRTSTVSEDATPESVSNVSSNEAKLNALKTENTKIAKGEPVVKVIAKKDENAMKPITSSVDTSKAKVKAEVKKEINKETGESKTVVNFKEAPKSMKGATLAPSSGGGSGSYFVQVSSHSSRAEADASWAKIEKQYGNEIGNSAKHIAEANVKGKTYYRLSFGPFADRGAASTKCGILKAKGQDCIIQKN